MVSGNACSVSDCCGFSRRSSQTRSPRASTPATLRWRAASNGSERENIHGNQKIQPGQQYQKIYSEEKFQQEKVEHEKIWPQGSEECRAGDEGVQAGKAEEWIGAQSHESETGNRDWIIGSQKIGRQSAEEKILQLRQHCPSRGDLQPARHLLAILMFWLGIQMEGRIHQRNVRQSLREIPGQLAGASVVFLRQQSDVIS